MAQAVPTGGSRNETIAAVKLSDLQIWHDRMPNGRMIVSPVHFDPAAMEAKLRAVFDALQTVTPSPARHEIFTAPTPGVYLIDKKDVDQIDMEIVGLGTDRRIPTSCARVLSDILGGGFDGRLFQTVRTKWVSPTRWMGDSSWSTIIPEPYAWKCYQECLDGGHNQGVLDRSPK